MWVWLILFVRRTTQTGEESLLNPKTLSKCWVDLTFVMFSFLSRPNSFVIITANRVIHCNTDTPEEMHHWIGLLQKSKGDTRVDGQEFLVRGVSQFWTDSIKKRRQFLNRNQDLNLFFLTSGWLHKEMKSGAKSTSLKLKKRWFVLTSNSLDYYKSSERNATKLGTLVLNSLCSVVQPDEKTFKDTGQFIQSRWSACSC